jgi:hypothetical protein
MAELDFEIHGKVGEIAASTFERAIARAVTLLREFDSAISGMSRGSLAWYIGKLHSNGNLLIRFASRLKRQPNRAPYAASISDIGPQVTSSFLGGFDDLENRCETPPYLSEFGLQQAEGLTKLIGQNGASGFRFASSDRAIEVTSKAAENIVKLLPIKRKAIGSVEGKLEAINLHKTPRVLVYHVITNKAVTCEFDPAQFMDLVKDYLGKRVIAYGTLHKNIKGDTLRVALDRLILADDLNKMIREEEKWGEPDFAKATSTAEYMRRIRGGG